ncbi:MAG TPA: type II secretion system F family protein [Candidatus Omnitrophica bacterium]|nr:MAG: hypothetical protein DRP61_02410 [Candidatus Omnitrophota bacterium]RKY35706.1 MAG: hypothetical protein DRP69_00390 [Candidatus Omnitrophota bacterium]RKY43446.1 MAG: hypothetical protein DRP80_05250 [Candidatus Omnitrophota bacterium]HEC68873.1 type II secretion system F family protein [Candidatus Omnitrophota bacterium]
MPKFAYKIRDKEGRLLEGILEATDKSSLIKSLSDKGYFVVRVSSYKEVKRIFSRKVSLDTLIMFTHQFGSLIAAGIPIISALEILWRQAEDKVFQLVISEVRNRLSEGGTLSGAFERFPNIFPEIYPSLLKVAERGGTLPKILKDIRDYLDKRRENLMKLKRAITYPLIVIIIAILAVGAMMLFVVPVFKKVFAKINVSLPFLTRILMDVSDFSVKFWWLGPVLIILGFFLYKKCYSTEKGRYRIDYWKLKLPLLGKLVFTASLGRFVHSFSLLVGGGLPLTESIETAKRSCANKVMEEKLDYVLERVIQGKGIGTSLEETKYFPPFITEMISIGEESGTLVEMLDRIALHLEEELDYRLNKFLTLLEPILIVMVGGMVMFVLLSMYLPIFTLWGKIGSGM